MRGDSCKGIIGFIQRGKQKMQDEMQRSATRRQAGARHTRRLIIVEDISHMHEAVCW